MQTAVSITETLNLLQVCLSSSFSLHFAQDWAPWLPEAPTPRPAIAKAVRAELEEPLAVSPEVGTWGSKPSQPRADGGILES